MKPGKLIVGIIVPCLAMILITFLFFVPTELIGRVQIAGGYGHCANNSNYTCVSTPVITNVYGSISYTTFGFGAISNGSTYSFVT